MQDEALLAYCQCVYCGDVATDRDHVVPVSYTSVCRNYSIGEIVNACSDCNGTLSNVMVCSVPERAGYPFDRLQDKRGKLLAFKEWTDAELAEVAPRMAATVRAKMARKRVLVARLENLDRARNGYEPIRFVKLRPLRPVCSAVAV
jgi:hypothetical protein